jgi:c-di-GMP-binding flagellar brake protein YcgR
MATPVGRIEKEYLLKALTDEKLPVTYIKDRIEYTLTHEYTAEDEMVFRPDKPLGKIKPRSKLSMLFSYRGQVVDFTSEILAQKDDLIYCKTPDTLYKNLDRNFLRVDAPSDLKIIFTLGGDRYNLALPKLNDSENIASDSSVRNIDSKNLSLLIKQITLSLKKFSDGFKIINFKDKKPETIEEKIVSEYGKILFIPSTAGSLPQTDPYPTKRIVTEDIFKSYLECLGGVSKAFVDDTYARFLKKKYKDGVYSDAWVPILFKEYIVGYIHIWIENAERPPLSYGVLDTVYQFAKVLSFSLKENGYFEHGKVNNEPFEGRVLDISASGLLFAYSLGSNLLSTLNDDAGLTVTIEAPTRIINVVAKIVRRFKDKSAGYLGCQFLDMAPEDKRFLFEHLYGRQLDSRDSAFLSGQV